MQVSFPFPVRVRSSVPTLKGLRHSPFTNIDNESFGKPALNGFWELEIGLIAKDQQSKMAASVFVTQMEAAGATCVIPVCVQWLPNDNRGRPLAGGGVAPSYTFDHTGFNQDPFDGFTLRAPASHRDSYIDILKPALSQLWPGHYITLDDRLYQVANVTSIDELDRRIRVSVMPNIRGDHDFGKVVVVDQLKLNCRMMEGDQIGASSDPVRFPNISLVEAF